MDGSAVVGLSSAEFMCQKGKDQPLSPEICCLQLWVWRGNERASVVLGPALQTRLNI